MVDVVVIGAGFGGLGCAVALAEAGARVRVHEALTYPGGCASTFSRRGYRFEAGATLFSGLAGHQLFGGWIERHRLGVEVDWIDPVVEVVAPGLRLPVDRDRDRFLDRLCALDGAPQAGIRSFFAAQRALADALWELFDDPELLPPLSAATLLRHLGRAPRYLPLAGLVGRPLDVLLARHGLAGFAPLRTWLRGLCQITVQCGPEEAEAPFALAAMDYFWRGTGHVRGGIGVLAGALAELVPRLGGEVRFGDRVKALRARPGGGWEVHTRTGVVHARRVVANLLPGDLATLLGDAAPPALLARQAPVDSGWGAVMLYRAVDGVGAPEGAHHLDIVDDPAAPFVDGNHVFVSASGASDPGRGPEGHRTLTISTHVALDRLRGQPPEQQARVVADVQARMRETLSRRAPGWVQAAVLEMTASPRTFARFTRRREGAVGGVPRRAGVGAYAQLGPVEAAPGVWLVGDSVFPGQSTYAVAVGGVRVAEAIRREG